MKQKILPWLLLLSLFSSNSFAEEFPVYHLGTIEVKSTYSAVPQYGAEEIYHDQIDTFSRNTIADALTLASGVNLTIGGRNERNFTIRGFDQRQVPVFLDGIPISQAYDGYVDLGLFNTAIIDSIIIPKGHSSVLYGSNTLGGSVNMLSVRPQNGIEGHLRSSFTSDSRRENRFSLGGKRGNYYAILVGELIEADGYRLSDDYPVNEIEDGGHRENSDLIKKTVYLKAGMTPSSDSELFIAYNQISGEWGMPPRISPSRPRYWRYNDWEKQTLYAVSDVHIDKLDVRSRFFYDWGGNVLDSYDDANYTTQTKRYAFHSTYKEQSYGSSLTLSYTNWNSHLLSLAVHYRQDIHKQQPNYGKDWERYNSDTWSIGIEDNLNITDKTSLLLGIGYDLVHPRYANGENLSGDKDGFNFSTGISYNFTPTGEIHLLISQKNRFPTLKELYSGYIDWNIPNPDLHEETTLNYEIGGEQLFGDNLILRIALFYSQIDDLIESIAVTNRIDQTQNIDSAEYRGVEMGAQWFLGENHELVLNYTYLDARNTSANRVSDRLPDRPRHTLTLGDSWNLTDNLSLTGLFHMESRRYCRERDDSVKRLPSYATFDLTVRYQVTQGIKIEAGTKNLFDRNYSLDIGLPREGCSFFAGLEAVF